MAVCLYNNRKMGHDSLQKQLEQKWHREMGLPLRLLLVVLVLLTYCCSMLAIGGYHLACALRKKRDGRP